MDKFSRPQFLSAAPAVASCTDERGSCCFYKSKVGFLTAHLTSGCSSEPSIDSSKEILEMAMSPKTRSLAPHSSLITGGGYWSCLSVSRCQYYWKRLIIRVSRPFFATLRVVDLLSSCGNCATSHCCMFLSGALELFLMSCNTQSAFNRLDLQRYYSSFV